MQIQYTARFLKSMSKIKDKRMIKDTEKVLSRIQQAENFVELYKILDINKLEEGLGGYRIRYSGKPEMRIRFDLLSDPMDKNKKTVELQFVGTREEYEKYAHKSMNESVSKKMIIFITEEQFKKVLTLTQNNVI